MISILQVHVRVCIHVLLTTTPTLMRTPSVASSVIYTPLQPLVYQDTSSGLSFFLLSLLFSDPPFHTFRSSLYIQRLLGHSVVYQGCQVCSIL